MVVTVVWLVNLAECLWPGVQLSLRYAIRMTMVHVQLLVIIARESRTLGNTHRKIRKDRIDLDARILWMKLRRGNELV